MNQRFISILILIAFSIPGIVGNGLHLVLPHKAPPLSDEPVQSSYRTCFLSPSFSIRRTAFCENRFSESVRMVLAKYIDQNSHTDHAVRIPAWFNSCKVCQFPFFLDYNKCDRPFSSKRPAVPPTNRFRFDPNCPICQFLTLTKVKQAFVQFALTAGLAEHICDYERKLVRFVFVHYSYIRGPPSYRSC